uniref:Uncharacterized protein n=1 Tax=Opuntia streptacantha TaxID=393608 RepID=A0A7C8Z381_OPUST
MQAEAPLVLWLHLKGTEDKLLGVSHLCILKEGRPHLNMAVEEVNILKRWRPFHHLACGTRILHKLRDLLVLSKGLRWRDLHPYTRMLLHPITGKLLNPTRKQRRDVAFLGFDTYDHLVSSRES